MFIIIKFRPEPEITEKIEEKPEIESPIDIETSWAEYFYDNAAKL